MKIAGLMALLLFLAEYGGNVVDKSNLVERGGLMYEVNSKTPFTGTAVIYYENGQTAEEGEYREGKQHGNWTAWHENGQKAREGEYHDGERHGNWTAWYENGQKALEGEYRDGELHGKMLSWYENGQKAEESEYREGKRHGNWTAWHENGQERDMELELLRMERDSNAAAVRGAVMLYYAESCAVDDTPHFPPILTADIFADGQVPPTASGTYTWEYNPTTGAVTTN